MATTTQTIKSKARIWPSSTQISNVNATVREVGSKLEVKWDGISWTDESTYLLSAKGNWEMSGTLGEGLASQADFELENTTKRFLPENTSSPIQSYLRPRRQLRYSVIVGGTEYLLFTGYIKGIEPKRKDGTVNLHCFDNAEIVLNKDAPRDAYVGKYAHELIGILGEAAGLDPNTDMDLEESDHYIQAAYFGDRHIWPIMGEIAVAERGRVFFDIDGRLKFWGRDHIQNQTKVMDLTNETHILDLNFSVEEQHIKNKITVRARPRAGGGIQPVWTNGAADVLNPYTETLLYIPANGTQNAYLEIEDPYGPLPCTDWVQPIPNTDFIANSEADGSGTDYTNSIRINTFNTYADAVFLEVQNLSSVDIYFTKFQVRANPLKIWKWISVRHTDEVSISEFGDQPIELENNFIDDEQMANDIAETELKRWKNAKNMFNAEIVGVPYLKVGDIVGVEITDGNSEEYMIETIDWEIDSGGFKQTLGFVNKIRFPTTQTVNARANIFNTTEQTVSAKARIGTAIKTIEAKAMITDFTRTQQTVTAKANIGGLQTVQAKARIKPVVVQTIEARANIIT